MIPKGILKISIVIICLLVPFFGFSRQSILDKKISLQAHNQTIATILKQIESEAGVNFVYMSGLFNKNKIISVSFTNKSLRIVLQKVLVSNDIMLYVIDNKIIFYKKDEAPPGNEGTTYALTPIVENTKNTNGENKADEIKNIVSDSIIYTIYDTIKITKYDTVKISKYDTIKVFEKPKTVNPSISKPKNISFIVSAIGGVNSISESSKSNTTNLLPTIIKKGEVSNPKQYETGIQFSFLLSHFSISSGLGFEQRTWNTEYNFARKFTDSSTIVGYNETAQYIISTYNYTILVWQPPKGQPPFGQPQFKDSIITIKDTTTIITRSPIYKKDSIKVNYKGLNTASYVTIPIVFSLNFNLTKKLEAIIGSGIKIHLLRKASGYTITDLNYHLSPLSENVKDFYLSSTSQFGLRYSISKHQVIQLIGGFGFSVSPIMKQYYYIKRSEQSISGIVSYGWKF